MIIPTSHGLFIMTLKVKLDLLWVISLSEKLEKKLKWEYDNDDNPHAKDWSNMKSPTEFIPKKELNQIPKNKKKLINYIPGTESF